MVGVVGCFWACEIADCVNGLLRVAVSKGRSGVRGLQVGRLISAGSGFSGGCGLDLGEQVLERGLPGPAFG